MSDSLITQEQFGHSFEKYKEAQEGFFETEPEYVHPELWIIARQDATPDATMEQIVCLLNGDFDTPEIKQNAMRTLGELVCQHNLVPVAVFFLSEAWMATMKEGEENALMPSQHPNREEVLILSGVDHTGRLRQCEIYKVQRLEQRFTEGPGKMQVKHEVSLKEGAEMNILDYFWLGYSTMYLKMSGAQDYGVSAMAEAEQQGINPTTPEFMDYLSKNIVEKFGSPWKNRQKFEDPDEQPPWQTMNMN